MEVIILDSNILIDILKGRQEAIDKVQDLSSPLSISVITAMELVVGARNIQEVTKLEQFIDIFEVIHLDQTISDLALKLITEYSKSHALDIPDSLIAATTMINRAKLFTYNIKDFRFIPKLDLYHE